MANCSNCGTKLAGFARFCYKCGTRNEDGPKVFICPICNNRIENNSDFCGKCGFKITKDLNYVIKESNSKSCPYCGNKNNIDAEFCGNCGKNLPVASYLELIECPVCKSHVRDDVNYCRFCGHNLNKTKKPLFGKSPKKGIRYCQNCGNKISNATQTEYCNKCGTIVPFNEVGYAGVLFSHEDYQLRFINNFIVPLSKEYDVNFRKVTLSQYFEISHDQELHIIYLIMKQIKNEYCENIISDFKNILEETKENYNNIEESIVNRVKKNINNSFNSYGFTISDVRTITDDYYDTIEVPVVQNKHGGLTKGAATLGFGLVGLAATSGVKQTTKTKKILNKGNYLHTSMNVSDKYITIKSYSDDSFADFFNSNKGNVEKIVIYWQDVNHIDAENYIVLNNGEAFRMPAFNPEFRIKEAFEEIVGTSDIKTMDKYKNMYYENVYQKVKDMPIDLIKKTINNKQSSNVTDMVQNIENESDMIECIACGKLNNSDSKFCRECGSKLENIANYCLNCNITYDDGEKFCTQCGSKLTTKN